MAKAVPNLPASSRMQMGSSSGSQIKNALKSKPLVVSGGAIKSKPIAGSGKGTTKKVMAAAKGRGMKGC